MTTAAPEDLLEPLVTNAGRLYSLPGVAMEVLRLTSQPYLDTKALKACLENDPALSTRILKVVNSSIFGLSRKVTDLSQALGLLGIKPLKMLVLGFSLPKQLWEGAEAETAAWYWRHSLVKAVAAREFSSSLFANDGDEMFLAALLQDIGILVLIQQAGSPYLRLLAEARGQPAALREMELQTFGFDHVVLGSRLLESWGLPSTLATAVMFPQERSAIVKMNLPDRAAAQVLHLAHLLATVLDEPAGPALGEMLEAGQSYCRLTIEDVQKVVAAVQAKVRDLAGILKLELENGDSYTDLITVAHAHLADVAAAAGSVLAWRNRESSLLKKSNDLRQELLQAAVASISGAPRAAGETRQQSPDGTGKPPAAHVTAAGAIAGRPPLAANPLLLRRVSEAVVRCRAARVPLTLAIVGIGEYGMNLERTSPNNAARLVSAIARGLTIWTEDRGPVWHLDQGRFALLWMDAQRNEAVALMRHALREAAAWSVLQPAGLAAGLTFSSGMATLALPSKNFPPQELIAGAERCLSGAILSGGHTVKSIEL